MQEFRVDLANADQRLDVFVASRLLALSRASVQKLCEQGRVLINTKPAKVSQKIKEGDEITLNYDWAELEYIPIIDLPIIYEDDDCVVINKPVGLLSHSKGAFNPEATVASWLRNRLADDWRLMTDNYRASRLGIVHRLDRATSGVMICAKNPTAMSWLQKQFSQRKVKKTYIALVQGQLDPPEAVIDMPIERNPQKPQTFRVGAGGKSATTQYRTLASNHTYSMLELAPTTGRTHQLRVHLAKLGHPIVGDSFYDGQPAERLFLHALSLEITLPNHERRQFSAPLPEKFEAMM